MLATLMQVMLVASTTSVDDAVTQPRLERMLEAGDEVMIIQTFRRHSEKVLPFIDEYLEGGLKMIEEGKPEEEALKSFRRGIAFAELADKAMRESVFSEYAGNFASWSPKERERFRAGQKAYRQARAKVEDPAEALTLYEKSMALADSLGDHWGRAMAIRGIADSLLALDRHEEAYKVASQAVDLHTRLRLRIGRIQAVLTSAVAYQKLGLGPRSHAQTASAMALLTEDDDPALRKRVAEVHAAALESMNRTEEADAVREEFGMGQNGAGKSRAGRR